MLDISSLLGGGGGSPAGSPGVGGSGKGASGAATFFGDNSAVFGNQNSGVPAWLVVVGAVASIAALLFVIRKK